jgi:GNAT superfamily N-acetyltransferase
MNLEAQPAAAGSVRPLRENELGEADRVMRLAFGTFLGLPDPLTFMGDADYVRTRWRTDPAAAIAAELNGELVGSNFVTNWGSFGFFGPLSVRPDLWNRGVARQLLVATMKLFERWGTRHAGLFTFPHSPKHLAIYQSFGFWPRFLSPVMSKAVQGSGHTVGWSRFDELPDRERNACLDACRALTAAIEPGLDLTSEIRAVQAQHLGETILLPGDEQLDGFAICHLGPGTEAGSGSCYVKFGAVRPGPSAGEIFERLLDAGEALAASRGLQRLVAGVNTARHDAYRRMLAHGFRADYVGIAMEWATGPGYNRPEVYIVDDWR